MLWFLDYHNQAEPARVSTLDESKCWYPL